MTADDRQTLEDRCKEALKLWNSTIGAGCRVSVEQGRLEIHGPADADPELRARLLGLMAPILPLFLMRDRLLALAQQMGLPRRLVMRIPPEWLRDLGDDFAEWECRKDADAYPNGQRYLTLYLLKVAELDATGRISGMAPADNPTSGYFPPKRAPSGGAET